MNEMTPPQSASAELTSNSATGLLDRIFRLTERDTSVSREVMAGATTFAAMAYIIAVNPAIMSNAGMDRADLVSATALAAIFGSVMMGLWANLPLAVAPAMGSNVIFTYVIVKQMGMPWQGALAMVAFTGVLFLILSLSKLRERVARDVPAVLKIGIQAAVGTLIVFIALRGAGFVVQNPSTYIAMGSLRSPPVLLTLAGLLLTPVLVARRVPGGRGTGAAAEAGTSAEGGSAGAGGGTRAGDEGDGVGRGAPADRGARAEGRPAAGGAGFFSASLAAHRGVAPDRWRDGVYAFIQARAQPQGALTVERMCALAQVSRAGYYRHWQASAPRQEETALRDAIQRVALAWPDYGHRRVAAQLRRQGWVVNRKRVQRLTREDNLLCLRRKPAWAGKRGTMIVWRISPRCSAVLR